MRSRGEEARRRRVTFHAATGRTECEISPLERSVILIFTSGQDGALLKQMYGAQLRLLNLIFNHQMVHSPKMKFPLAIQNFLAVVGFILTLVPIKSFAAQTQTIEFTPPARVTWSSTPLSLSATASSGLPVTFSVASGPGTLSGNQLTFTGAGNVVVRAEQSGNEEYLSATVERTITVEKSLQTIVWPSLNEPLLAQNTPYPLEAEASSGLPVTFRIEQGPAKIENGALVVTGVGGLSVVAEQAGDERYLPASIAKSFNAPESLILAETAHWPLPRLRGPTQEVVRSGNYIYAAVEKAGVQIMDVSNAGPPAVVSWIPLIRAFAVDISGNNLFVAEFNGFSIYDISNPLSPRRLGSVPLNSSPADVAISGQYAYLAAGSLGFYAVRVTDPALPTIVEGIPGGFAAKVVTEGNYAYVLYTSPNNFVIYDITNRAKPIKRGSMPLVAPPTGIAVSGSYAYVANQNEGLLIIDVTNPAIPQLAGKFDPNDENAFAVDIMGATALLSYVASNESKAVLAVDVSNPVAPREVSRYAPRASVVDISVAGNSAVLSEGEYGVEVVDLSDISQMKRLGTYATGGETERLDLSGNHAYLAEGLIGLRIVDITNPAAPRETSNYQTTGLAKDVEVKGNLAFVASQGLEIIDVTDPSRPVRISYYDTTGRGAAAAVALYSNYAIVGLSTRVEIIDVSNPSVPAMVGSIPIIATRINVRGNYAFFSPNYRVYDLTNPASPQLVSSDSTPTADIDFNGNLGYLIRSRSLVSLDLTDIENPVTLGALPLSLPKAVEVAGNLAFVADGSSGLRAIDVTAPRAPRLLSRIDAALASDVKISGDYAYLADNIGGLRIFNFDVQYRQTIYFNPPSQVPLSASPLTLTASASSGLPVTFSVRSGPATIQGNQLTLTGTGVVTVRARQAGDDQFAVWTVDKTITVVESAARPEVGVRTGTNGSLEFHWPASSTNYRLQKAESLTDPDWMDISTQAVLVNGEYIVTLSPSEPEGYFRLVQVP